MPSIPSSGNQSFQLQRPPLARHPSSGHSGSILRPRLILSYTWRGSTIWNRFQPSSLSTPIVVLPISFYTMLYIRTLALRSRGDAGASDFLDPAWLKLGEAPVWCPRRPAQPAKGFWGVGLFSVMSDDDTPPCVEGPDPVPDRAATAATWLGREPPLTPATEAAVAVLPSSRPASTPPPPPPLEGTFATPEESAAAVGSSMLWREVLLPLEQPSTQRFHALQELICPRQSDQWIIDQFIR